MRRFVLLLLTCALPAAAQTTTTYTGTIKDLTQTVITSGRITFTLKPPGVSNISGSGSFVSSTVSCLINATGNPVSSSDGVSPCVVTNNTSLTPTGTYYNICIQPYNQAPGSCLNAFALGGSVDISTLVPTAATQPNYGVGAANGIAPLDGSARLPEANLPTGAATTDTTSAQTFLGPITATVNNTLNPDMCVNTSKPSWCAGTDRGAWINAAVAYGLTTWGGVKVILPGTAASVSTTIAITSLASYQNVTIDCQSGVLNYTGSGDLFYLQNAAAVSNVRIQNCTLDGTGAGAAANGVDIQNSGGFTMINSTVKKFGGHGLLHRGAIGATYINTTLYSNGTSVLEEPDSVSGTTTNATRFIGGSLQWPTVAQWQEQLVGSNPDQNDYIIGAVLESSLRSPQVQFDACQGCGVVSSYLEDNAAGVSGFGQVSIGNQTGSGFGMNANEEADGIAVENNFFTSPASSYSVAVYNTKAASVQRNTEEGNPAYNVSFPASPTLHLSGVAATGNVWNWATGPFQNGANSYFSAQDVSNSLNAINALGPVSATGYQISGAAGSGHVLRGNGTNFVDSALASADLSDSSSLPRIIATGTSALGTAAITSGACASVVTTAASNVAATDSIAWSFNAAPGSGWPGLNIQPYPTSGNVNFLVCNPTAGSITPAAATLNWKVTR